MAKQLRTILDLNGTKLNLDERDCMTDFYDWFHTNILNYHGNTIVEL